jgi:hypothetical protein
MRKQVGITIISNSKREGHYGAEGGDLYISYKNNNETWKDAVHLGAVFNEEQLSSSFPRLFPNGKYLFFLKLISVLWKADVYWVSVDALERLNKNE